MSTGDEKPGAAETLLAAGPQDAPALAALHALAFPPEEAWGVDALCLMLELSGAFGLQSPGAGFILARVAADEAEVLTLAVAPSARRRGLGAALLEGAMALAAAQGAVKAFLEVSTANNAGLGLYADAGFVEVGRRRRYYADGSDALVLSRPCAK